MAEIRTFYCDVPECEGHYKETKFGEGAKDFGKFIGIILNDVDAPIFCEGHRAMVADFVDSLKGNPTAIDISK